MSIYLYLAMFILIIIYSKVILIKTSQTTFILFNQFYVIVSKHKSILSKSIMSESIYQNQLCQNQFYPKLNQTHTKKERNSGGVVFELD